MFLRVELMILVTATVTLLTKATTTVPTEFDPEDEGALMFGITPTSHLQYPTLDSTFQTSGLITLDVKTNATSGVLFYVSDSRQEDKSFAYIKDGYVFFGFDYGSGPLIMQSNKQINDGNWHHLHFGLVSATGTVRIDGIVSQDEIGRSSSYLTVSEPFYLGGLPRDHMGTGIELTSKNSLRGCIKNLSLNGMLVGEPDAQFEVEPCTGKINCDIKPRRYDITDRGVASYFQGWVDVQGQGSSNDYCRVVVGRTGHYFSCALGGTTGDSEHNFNSPDAVRFDKGYSSTWYMKDEDGDGKDDYCRCVGNSPNTWFSCMKAGDTGFIGNYDFSPDRPGDCNLLEANPFLGPP